jgi:hypothetical protein
LIANYTIRLWDARTGEAIGKPLGGHINWIPRLWGAFTGKQIEDHAGAGLL